MEQKRIKDTICDLCINDFRVLDKYKEKSDIEIILDLYAHKVSEYCKINNVSIKDFSIKKDDFNVYTIEINFDDYGNINL
jgi:hypothetical protein